MTPTEDKILKIAQHVVSNRVSGVGEISEQVGCGNPLTRSVIRAMEMSNNKTVDFGGKKVRVSQS